MPPPLPYFKVNICPFPLPHYASIFFAYLWSFRWPNYIVTLPRYFSFRLPHLNIPTGAPSDELDNNIFFLSHYALGTVECDESYCNDGGGPYLVVGGAGNSFTMSHTATRGSSWPYMDFKFFVTSVPGVGLCPYMAYGRGLPIYGNALAPWVFGVTKMS
jgi:hypothetical protein